MLASLRKKLSQLREEARDYLVGNGMAVPKPLIWAKNNNPEEWWSTTLKFFVQYLHDYILIKSSMSMGSHQSSGCLHTHRKHHHLILLTGPLPQSGNVK
jgi:hypothetical protein